MQKHFRIPLFFLVISSVIGIILRWSFVSPIQGLQYGNWLHTHSHMMFLGWVFNFFNLAFLYQAFGQEWRKPYKVLFYINQLLIVAMLVSFPLQGYGSITIPLSTVHTLVTGFFCVRFILDTRHLSNDHSRWLAKLSLILFLISAVGPFMLAPIMANGLGQTKWYYFAIYYYLHFQYNGVFFFGVLSIFSKLLQEKGVTEIPNIRSIGWIFFVACFPAYALSILWAEPPAIYYWIGFLGAAIQLVGLAMLASSLIKIFTQDKLIFSRASSMLLGIVVVSLALKLLMQFVSAHPYYATLAFENRYLVIGYLHLVLVGVISFGMLVWYIEKKFLYNLNPLWVAFLIGGFIGSEVIMFTIPYFTRIAQFGSQLIFSFSGVMFLGFSGLLLYNQKQKDARC
jgi:hypothetical protein